MVQATSDKVRQHKLIEEEQENIRNLQQNIKNLEAQINAKNQSIIDARHTLNTLEYPTTVAQAEEKIKERRQEEIRKQVLKYQEKQEQELKEQLLKFQQEKQKELKEQVLRYQIQKEDELRSLSPRFKNLETMSLDGEELVKQNIIELPKSEEEKTEEEKLRDLIKKLEEQDFDEDMPISSEDDGFEDEEELEDDNIISFPSDDEEDFEDDEVEQKVNMAK